MSRHRLFKIGGYAGLFFVLLLWALLFFFPHTIEVNRLRRQVKDLGDELQKSQMSEDHYQLPDQEELARLDSAERDLRSLLPAVKGSEDFLRLITDVSRLLKETATSEGLNNLIVSSNSQDLEINAQTLPQSGQSLEELLQFTSNRLREIQLEIDRKQGQAEAAAPGPFGLSSHTLFLTFSVETKAALSFLLRLPGLERSLRIDKVLVGSGRSHPLFLVYVVIHYWDERSPVEAGGGNA